MRFLILAVSLAVILASCSSLPAQVKTDRQIAKEIVDCMLRADPEAGVGIAFMGGKDSVAETMEQSATREQLVAERNKECGKLDRRTKVAATMEHNQKITDRIATFEAEERGTREP